MTIARARALAPELVVADAEPEEDLAGLERLALWAGRRYSPVVAIDPPAGIWIDITGCCGRFEGELPLLKDLHRRVVASGFAVQVAVADTAGCAHAVARHVPAGQPIVIDPGKTRAALSLLPVAALRIEPGIAAELTRMGFARVEQLIATSRAPLVKRFGAGLMTRLDQALGQRPEPIEPIFPPEIPRCRRRLLEPIGTAEAFTQVIGDLAASLVRKLTRASTGVRRLDLIFHRVDGQAQAIRVGTAKPTRDARHIAKLLAQKLETVDPGMGVEAMTLVASLTEPLGSAQGEGLLSAQRKGPDLAALVDALANRFGQRALCRTIPQPGTMPERQVAIVAPLAKACGAGWADDLPRRCPIIRRRCFAGVAGAIASPRPMARSASMANGGAQRAMKPIRPTLCAIIIRSRPRAANVIGCSASAMASARRPGRCAGSSTARSHDRRSA